MIRVAIDHAVLDRSLDGAIVSAFAALRAAGYDFRYAPDGTPYQLLITRRFVLTCQDVFIGYWHREEQTISIAPECFGTEAVFRNVIAHELLHSLNGAKHICRTRDEIIERRRAGDDCTTVGYGLAVLNAHPDYDGIASPSELTDLDLAELRRVGAIH